MRAIAKGDHRDDFEAGQEAVSRPLAQVGRRGVGIHFATAGPMLMGLSHQACEGGDLFPKLPAEVFRRKTEAHRRGVRGTCEV